MRQLIVYASGCTASNRNGQWICCARARVCLDFCGFFPCPNRLIHKHAGISLHDGKHAMVYSRLSRRLRETGYEKF